MDSKGTQHKRHTQQQPKNGESGYEAVLRDVTAPRSCLLRCRGTVETMLLRLNTLSAVATGRFHLVPAECFPPVLLA